MHIGVPAKTCVAVGDSVTVGELIGKADGFISANVYASISGRVTAIAPANHPLGRKLPAIEITAETPDSPSGQQPITAPHLTHWQELEPTVINERIKEMGVVGRGGACFPTNVKLAPPAGVTIDTLIINGAECEPYLTSDHRLMLERTEQFLTGTAISMRVLGVSIAFIGIEKNKPSAIKAVKEQIKKMKLVGVKVKSLETKYPQGGEKQLISAITGRIVPSGKLPMDVQCVVQNVGTAHSIYKAVVLGTPLCHRVVTVSGDGVKKPGNYIIPIGTSIREILAYTDTDLSSVKKVILGGPMMGVTLSSLDTPIIKSTSGILVLSTTTPAVQEYNCINCGACVDVCPIRLVPSHLSKMVRQTQIQEAMNLNIKDCIECGACSYICPSKINLLHDIRLGKNRSLTLAPSKK